MIANIIDPVLFPYLFENQSRLEKCAKLKMRCRWFLPWRYITFGVQLLFYVRFMVRFNKQLESELILYDAQA